MRQPTHYEIRKAQMDIETHVTNKKVFDFLSSMVDELGIDNLDNQVIDHLRADEVAQIEVKEFIQKMGDFITSQWSQDIKDYQQSA